ncbi:MAG: HD domain-containing protein [Lachnospiraceae bacterium]|nr:HD domain-containing protein [Lachnospiraceae bacterium]
MSIVRFFEIKDEQVKGAYFLVTKLEDKIKNCKYVIATLSDGETIQNVNLFAPGGLTVSTLETMGIVKDSIIETDIVKSDIYFNVQNWKVCTDSSITKADFVRKAPIDIEGVYNRIVATVKEVDSNPNDEGDSKSLSFMTIRMLESYKDLFKRSAAAVKMHHNFIGGLLFHTYRMLQLALRFCEVYVNLDKELLVCGTVLHDIGKISCLKTEDTGEASFTTMGRLFDHALTGVLMVQEEARKFQYNPEKVEMLQHMIASHHGKKEWDAIVTPAFPEAEILHMIDMSDSRMNMFEEAYKGVEAGTLSESKIWGLENSTVYKASFYE